MSDSPGGTPARASLERASQLYGLHRYSLAIKEIDALLSREPGNARAYCLKSLSHLAKKDIENAVSSAQKAVALGPEDDYTHYVLGLVYLERRENYKKSEVSIREALRINPERADYYDVLAHLMIAKHELQEARRLCERGLEIDPENADCLGTRARVLAKMGKKAQAKQVLDRSLSADAQNTYALANAGWVRLETGDHKGALEAFRDSLKVSPDNEHARDGLVQALKAKHFFFRQFLRYTFWLNRLGSRTRWALVLGLYLMVRLLALAPAMKGVLALYVLFVLSTWLVDPVFDLFLRFDRYGRYALTRTETIASNLVAACIVLAVTLAATGIIGNLGILFLGAIAVLLLSIPISRTASFHSDGPRKYRKALAFTIVLSSLVLLGFVSFPFSATVGFTAMAASIAGQMVFTWFAALVR